MFRLFALREERPTALAYHCAEGMRSRCGSRRALPRRDATTVHVRGEKVPVVARAREDIGRDFCGVPGNRRGGVDVLATLLVKSLVEKEVEFNVGPRFPQGLDSIEDIELDANMLLGALREKDCRSHVGWNRQ